MEQVLELQGSGEASAWSWASPGWVSLASTPLASLTLCVHVLIPAFRASATLFSYGTNTTDNFFTVDMSLMTTSLCVGGVWSQTPALVSPGTWTSTCFVYNSADVTWSLYLDGRLSDTVHLDQNKGKAAVREVAGAGWVVLGQDQDYLGGGYQKDQSFYGLVARLRLWGRALSPTVVARVARCEDHRDQDEILRWPSAKAWQLNHTARVVDIPREDICREKVPYLALLSPRMSFLTARRLCIAMGSVIATPTSYRENGALLDLARKVDPSCFGELDEPFLWLGATDHTQEGRWVDETTRVLFYANWKSGQPNGGKMENQAVMTGHGTWMDLRPPVYSYCAACRTRGDRPLVVLVKGLCSGLPHDTRYVQKGHFLAKPFFRGFTTSSISWNGSLWLASHPESPDMVLSHMPEESYEVPLGRRPWVLAGDRVCGDRGGGLLLTITTCSSDTFTCDDGSCLPMHKRCDFQVDCPDESDEDACYLVTLPPTYKLNIPPRVSSDHTAHAASSDHTAHAASSDHTAHAHVIDARNPTAYPVTLHVSVLELEIVTEKMEIVMDMEVLLQWLDPRLVLNNLKHDSVTNSLQLDVIRSLWIPQVSFANAKGNAHTLVDEETRGVVLRKGRPVPGDGSHAREVHFFSGGENPIQVTRKYSATYRCSLNLALYPFDTQGCFFTFVLTSARKEILELVAEATDAGVNYLGSWQLLEYTIISISMHDKNHTTHSQKEVVVRFRRRYGFAILTVYVPSTFFVIIAYLTTFFPLTNLQVRVVIGLTAMLVLTTLFNQVSNQLPRNSYFKALDMWMFGAIGIIFTILIMQTIVDVVFCKEQTKVRSSQGKKQVVTARRVQVGAAGLAAAPRAPPGPLAPRLLRTMQLGFPVLILALILSHVIYVLASVQ